MDKDCRKIRLNCTDLEQFPDNILYRLKMEAMKKPDDLIPTLYYVIYEAGAEYDKKNPIIVGDVYMEYFRNKHDIRTISTKYRMNLKQVMAILNGITRTLQKQPYKSMIEFGLKEYAENQVKILQNNNECKSDKSFIEKCFCKQDEIDEHHRDSTDTLLEAGMSLRVRNCLNRHMLFTVDDVIHAGTSVAGYKGFGKKCYDELVTILVSYYNQDPREWEL